ncbi:MAG TPA: DUF411 domain-containing protein [Gemmatimonadaceae bacterium]
MSRQRRKHHEAGAAGSDQRPRAHVSRRAFIGSAAGGAAVLVLGGLVWQRRSLGADLGTVTVYKAPTCECCGKWIAHMRSSGFTLDVRDLPDIVSAKRNLNVPTQLYSCHTSEVGNYVFEGHVPADLVARVIRERPDIRGLAVPGMPQSAPGMDVGRQRYEVIAFTKTGDTSVYEVRSS